MNLAHRYGYRGDRARYTRAVVDEVVRLRKIRMIKKVKEFRAEFKSLRFRHSKLFSQRSVKYVLTGPDQVVTPRIAKRDPGRRRERIYIEPQVRISFIGRQVPIPELIGP